MTNASCADCGRIVAFRTHDPSEIAECRNCGTWVKRSAEMPGVAVSVKKDGPTARKTAIPPRKDQVKDPALNPNINTQRSATKRTSDRPVDNGDGGNGGNGNGSSMSAASVYAAIRDLQKSVHDLRTGQKTILADQKKLQASQQDFQNAHKALHEGQKALHSGQKQLFGQYQEIQQSQHSLMEKMLVVPEMPVSRQSGQGTATAIPLGPLTAFEEGTPPENGFHTTPFSSLKIPLIPIKLEDLDVNPRFTEEGTAFAIPEEERTDRAGLIENPLPEPAPYTEPEPEPEVEETTGQEPQPEASPFKEAAFDDTAFETKPVAGQAEALDDNPETDPFLTSAAHASPFTIEGPPTDPFTIAEPDTASETTPAAEQQQEPAEGSGESPFAAAPQPFGAKDYTHEPCELQDPFAETLPGNEAAPSENAEENPDHSPAPEAETLPESAEDPAEKKSLSQQIAAAKENQEASPFDPAQRDLLTEPEKSKILPILGAALGLLALVGLFFFLTNFQKDKETPLAPAPPLVEFPPYGIPLPEDDARVTEAETVAEKFLGAKTQAEVESIIRPVDTTLLVDFWEPMTAPTIERIFQGRILENDRVEVDFLVKDFGREERLLPLIKIGDGPFQVDWQSFTECEEVTLLGIAQGTLILDSGKKIDGAGSIRSWMQSGKEMAKDMDLGNFQGFKLHNFTEQVVAFAVVRKDSSEFEILSKALASTELKHKGKPAIRAVLQVKRIEEEDTDNGKPARLEILKVISTDWKHHDDSNNSSDGIIKEELPPSDKPEPAEKETTPAPEEASTTKEEEKPEPVAEEKWPDQLPPVPDEGDPLALHPGETPIIKVTYD